MQDLGISLIIAAVIVAGVCFAYRKKASKR
jgi:hypothetical protein